MMFANKKNDITIDKFKKAAHLKKNKMAAIRRNFRRGTDPYIFSIVINYVPSFMLL